jgi:putative DNA primase/helicase
MVNEPPDDPNEPPPHDFIPNDPNEIRIDTNVVDDTAPGLSEMDVARTFVARHGETLRFVAPWKKWLLWNGQRWEDDDRRQAHYLADQICIETARGAGKRANTIASAGFRTNVLSLASEHPQLAASVTGWDADQFLLNTPNGVVNLKTGTMRVAQPTDYMRMMTQVGPNATIGNAGEGCPRWKKFLSQIFDDDSALVTYVQRICGYVLTGSIEEHQMWFGYGSGNNGKGVFVDVVSGLMGDYHTNTPIETFTVQQFDAHPTELARLHGKRLVTSSETEEGRRWAESRIKEITGGGKISARFMRQDFFDFYPQFKIFLTGNHMPVMRNVGAAMIRRFNRIPFDVTIATEEVNKNLAKELIEEEGPEIILWMIRGCVDWMREGLPKPLAVKMATDSYFSDQDQLGEWINTCLEADQAGWIGTTDLFNSWKMWAEARQEYFGNVKWFSMKLQDRKFVKRRNKDKTLHGFGGWKLKQYATMNGNGSTYNGNGHEDNDLPF